MTRRTTTCLSTPADSQSSLLGSASMRTSARPSATRHCLPDSSRSSAAEPPDQDHLTHLPHTAGQAASSRESHAHLGPDGVSEGVAVGVLAYEARVDDV